MRHRLAWVLLACVNAVSVGVPSAASLPPPRELLARVGFEQRLGAPLPLTLEFHDAHSALRPLASLLAGRPTLLVPGYYRCINLCDVVRAGVARAVAAAGLTPGEQFNLVLFSIDPRETPADAAAAQREDARAHPGARVMRWQYLTGGPQPDAALARSVGFHYFLDPRTDQYAHTAGVVVLSPQGRVTQYLLGVQFAPRTLRLALVNASQGHLGTIADRLLLLCCDYDFMTGHYTLLVRRVLQGLGLLTALTLAGLLLTLRRAELRRAAPGRS